MNRNVSPSHKNDLVRVFAIVDGRSRWSRVEIEHLCRTWGLTKGETQAVKLRVLRADKPQIPAPAVRPAWMDNA